jgi:MoxR-vWA-beta-propeller ternary system domain bpX1
MIDWRVGTLQYRRGPNDVRSITPLSDGRPALKGGRIVRARRGGDALAVLVEGALAPGLYFISLAQATVLGILNLGDEPAASLFALSRDGRRFARLLGDRRIEVRDVPGDRAAVLVTPQEELWIHFASWGKSCLLVREFGLGGPRRPHSFALICWDQGRLEAIQHEPVSLFQRLGGVVAESRSLSPGKAGLDYDPHRFVQSIELPGLRVLIDRYNHLVVLGRGGELLCMFYVAWDEVAAWMPDGTCWGSRRLIGGEPTPGAAERIAAVLRSAERGEGACR